MSKPPLTETPPFEEWVDYCFTLGFHDWAATNPDGDLAAERRRERFWWLPAHVVASLMTRLFEDPAWIAQRYSDEQIGCAVRLFFGVASEWFKMIRDGSVPPDVLIRCYTSVGTFYTELLDRVCCGRGAAPREDFIGKLALDGAVFMIWDMDNIEGALMFPEKAPYLVDPGFAVLERVLRECRTSTCQMSSLHGLGEIHMYHPARCEAIIDAYLAKPDLPPWLREYAEAARTGGVQ